MSEVKLYTGDLRDVLAGSLEANSVDTAITDPPYGLTDLSPSKVAQIIQGWLSVGDAQLNGSGFMGREWDACAPGPSHWRAVYRVLKPGGLALVFGGTRTHDLLTLALRLAGFEIIDVMSWVYGSGFPGGLNISKAIDKAAGAEREKVQPGNQPGFQRTVGNDRPWMYDDDHKIDGPIPATPEAELWDGWGTRLKPAWEPIIIAVKPRDGTFVNNALKWGVAGYWIDGGRITIDIQEALRSGDFRTTAAGSSIGIPLLYRGENKKGRCIVDNPHPFSVRHNAKGRWPANFVLQHAAGCVCRGTREVKGHKGYPNGPGGNVSRHADVITGGKEWANTPYEGHADSNGNETIADWDCVPGCPVRTLAEQGGDALDDDGPQSRFFYQAKASPSERHAGLEDFYWRRDGDNPFGFTRISREEYERLPKRKRAQGNVHPTVKPIELMRYLARLTRTPTGGVVLDPFCGSGSTGVGCVAEGRSFIGVDMLPECIEITEARIGHAQQCNYTSPAVKVQVATPSEIPAEDEAQLVLPLGEAADV